MTKSPKLKLPSQNCKSITTSAKHKHRKATTTMTKAPTQKPSARALKAMATVKAVMAKHNIGPFVPQYGPNDKSRITRPKVCKCGKHTRPEYGMPGSEIAEYCGTCRLPGMTNLYSKRCGCTKNRQPCFGYKSDTRPSKCKDCRLQGMIDIVSPKCGCSLNKKPIFGYPSDTNATRCKACRSEGMVDLKNMMCGCEANKRPSYGDDGDLRPTKCKQCMLPGMVNVVSKTCGCSKNRQPSFGFVHDPRPTKCSSCRDAGMIDIRRKKCVCGLRFATFGHSQDSGPTHCTQCKSEGMSDLRHTRCQCPEYKVAHFGEATDSKPTCCSSCKTATMINIASIHCKCPLRCRATFGSSADGKAVCCISCKSPDMTDVVHAFCAHGSRLEHCTGSSSTCGVKLGSRSKEEIYQAALVQMCMDNTVTIEQFVDNLRAKYTPQTEWDDEYDVERTVKAINVDATFNNVHFEYDGLYYHRDKLATDKAKTMQILKDKDQKVFRVRDRLPSLGIVNDKYREIIVDCSKGHEIVAKSVWTEYFKTDSDNDWPDLWRHVKSLADRAIMHFCDPKQETMDKFVK